MAKILTFSAKTNRELGRKLGSHFHRQIKQRLETARKRPTWPTELHNAEAYLRATRRFFPLYVEEIEGYAQAAAVSFKDLWAVGLDTGLGIEQCTTAVSSGAKFIGHTEDFDPGSDRDVFVVRRILPKSDVLELFYFYSLGGAASGVNSHGIIHLTNTLHASWSTEGVPRNIIARWLSETKDPMREIPRLRRIPRSDGYSHTFITRDGEVISVEYTCSKVSVRRARTPFVHTNHFLTDLVKEESGRSDSSVERFAFAKAHAGKVESLSDMKRLLADRSKGKFLSVRNENTIARSVFDREGSSLHVLLERQRVPIYQKIPFPEAPFRPLP